MSLSVGAAEFGVVWELRRTQRRWIALFIAVLLSAAVAPAAVASRGTAWLFERGVSYARIDPGVATTGHATEAVIVQARPGQTAAAATWAAHHGATVGAPLPIIDGFAAAVPADMVRALAASPAVLAITADRKASFDGFGFDSTTTTSNFVATSGAGPAWTKNLLGDGVSVAVIDTGISPMHDFGSRVIYGPDLSGEGSIIDSYGHGTVMAGIIGGNGADSVSNPGGAYTGVAPHVNLVSVKVAGRNGSADVSTILQAMHWVSAYASQYNIRVVNLSWGVASTQDPSVDPIDYAVERLWKQGIVMAVAAGNSGPQAGTITKPGDDPLALTVGALDDKQNTDPSDDSLPSWSSQGPTAQGLTKPDVIAPGRYIIATRSFGSYVEQNYPKALRDPSYIRGSGTSEATAVTAGAAALLIQSNPALTPDQVKALFKSTASPLASVGANGQGAGRINVASAIAAVPGPAQWQASSASGLGSIETSRGGQHVQTVCPQDGVTRTIQGEMDVKCEQWSGTAWTGSSWTGSSWTGSSWTGGSWTGTAWTGTAWTGGSWTGTAWTGGSWTGGSWTGTAWTGTAWTGTAWTGTAWTGTAWTGTAWTGSSWTGTAWTGTAWTGTAWTGGSYDDFLTAFWGDHPPMGKHLSGEVSDRMPRNIA